MNEVDIKEIKQYVGKGAITRYAINCLFALTCIAAVGELVLVYSRYGVCP